MIFFIRILAIVLFFVILWIIARRALAIVNNVAAPFRSRKRKPKIVKCVVKNSQTQEYLNERRKILEQVQSRQISAAEGEKLLDALESAQDG